MNDTTDDEVAPGHTNLVSSRALGSEFIDAAPDAILVVRSDGTIAVANHQALDLFGYRHEELVGSPVELLVPPSSRKRHAEHRSGYQQEPRVRHMGELQTQLMGRRADGSKLPVEIGLSPVVVDGTPYTMAIIRDVTERLNIDRQQAVMKQRLAVSEDRDRIARDLHDLVIQRIFATGMRLQAALNDPDRLRDRATGAISELDETIAVLRESIFRLTSPTESLSSRVRSLLMHHDISVQCDVDLHIDDDLDSLPDSLGEHLVPTLNEALSNVVRHARASSVTISLAIEAGSALAVRVIDDGIGIDPDSTPGFGLANLRQRAQQLGGTMEIRTLPDGGTDLEWSVPIER
ncbi:MAG: PAS domain-containing sensor histidine kinase [Acidimicrobiales bacterium]